MLVGIARETVGEGMLSRLLLCSVNGVLLGILQRVAVSSLPHPGVCFWASAGDFVLVLLDPCVLWYYVRGAARSSAGVCSVVRFFPLFFSRNGCGEAFGVPRV